MKVILKSVICLALLLLSPLIMSACNSTDLPTIEVRSADYDISILKASELNDTFFETHASDQYDAFYSYVSATNSYGNASPIDGECNINTVCDIALGDAVACTKTANNVFYVITNSSFYSVTMDGAVTEIQVPSQWVKLQVTSIVEIENMIYVGTKYGVLEYSSSENIFTWFPVEYEEVIA